MGRARGESGPGQGRAWLDLKVPVGGGVLRAGVAGALRVPVGGMGGGVAGLGRGEGAGLPQQDELLQPGEKPGEAGQNQGVETALCCLCRGGGAQAGETVDQ